MLERRVTEPGNKPEGDGWTCIHAGCSYDRAMGSGGRYWLWQRVRVDGVGAEDEQLAQQALREMGVQS